MELFCNGTSNLLPKDGTAYYYRKLFQTRDADHFFDQLMTNIEWKNDQVIVYGKLITTKRKVAWYGDLAFEYTYSNITKKAIPWSTDLLKLKTFTEQKTGEHFNSCLLNLYHDGSESMGWHSDNEDMLKKNGAIASLSFGAERRFVFKHKQTKQTVSLTLEHGSLLLMKDSTQTHWLHRLAPASRITKSRVNLTFRTVVL